MVDESLAEFGYIVARVEVLGDAELTANTPVNKIVSPSFKKVNGEVTINKYERGTDNTTFAAVLVNIPNTNYGDKFAVRPYVVYGGEYYYGNTITFSSWKSPSARRRPTSSSVSIFCVRKPCSRCNCSRLLAW